MKSQPLFLLASQSPRRKLLLESLGIPFETVENPWTETPRPGERAESQVKRLSREKLDHYWHLHPETDLPVLTADTLLERGGKPLGKPATEQEAWENYKTLAGKSHRVLTSLSMRLPSGKVVSHLESTKVHFVPWDEALFRLYLARQEWRDAAGGYRIQETGEILIRKIEGSWSNVVGLPLSAFYGILRRHHVLG